MIMMKTKEALTQSVREGFTKKYRKKCGDLPNLVLHLVPSKRKKIFRYFCYISLPLSKICYQRGTGTHTLHDIKSFCNDIGGWDQV